MRCGPPSGMGSNCTRRARWLLNFGCDTAGGNWALCSECLLLTTFYLEDKYVHAVPVFERRRL